MDEYIADVLEIEDNPSGYHLLVNAAHDMRAEPSWTKPWWLGLHAFTEIRGEVVNYSIPAYKAPGYKYADALHGEIPWR